MASRGEFHPALPQDETEAQAEGVFPDLARFAVHCLLAKCAADPATARCTYSSGSSTFRAGIAFTIR